MKKILWVILMVTVWLQQMVYASDQPLEGNAATIESLSGGEIAPFNIGIKLFTNRPYVLAECPGFLFGVPFLRDRMEGVAFRVLKDGVLTILTPESDQYKSAQFQTLEKEKFTRICAPEHFQLFGDFSANKVRIYQKTVNAGEEYIFKKWTVVLGFLSTDTSASQAENKRMRGEARLPKVYLLLFGGQSNALGWGYQKYLIDHKSPLANPQQDIDLFYSIAGEGYLPENTLLKLQSGTSNKMEKRGGHYPELKAPVSRFGPELSMARMVKDRLALPDAKVAIMKFAHGGTSLYDIKDWKPDGTSDARRDGKLYQIFQATVRKAVAALEKTYPDREVEILGMGWVQGESDALEYKGDEYGRHLATFIEDIRATYGEQVVFSFSQVSPAQYEYSDNEAWVEQWLKVAHAQEKGSASLPKVRMTKTTGAKYPVCSDTSEGTFHYSTAGLLQIGQDLGNAIAELSGLPLKGDNPFEEEDYTLRKVSGIPIIGSAAEVRIESGETDQFEAGVKVFSNRDFPLNNPPAFLAEKPFVRAPIDSLDFKVTRGGKLYVLTPDPRSVSISQSDTLEANGFRIINNEPLYLLFGTNPGNSVCIYEKDVKPGESYSFGKWAVVVGAEQSSSVQRFSMHSSPRTQEEVLYNGIRLPVVWPPTDVSPSRNPMPVSYLEHRPEVVPVDVGRQLFVDDFLIEKTDLKRQFHYPKKYAGNPILFPQTDLELDPVLGLAVAAPKSGGIWWEPKEQIFKLWYETGWFGGIGLATSRDGLRWERPSVGGTGPKRAPNEVTPPNIRPDSWTVTQDLFTEDPNARYKLFLRKPGGSHAIGAKCYQSPDGITWSAPVTSGPMGDRSTAFYNPFRKKWVFSLRSFFSGRARHYWESDEFMKGNVWTWDETDFWKGTGWTEGEPVVWVGADNLDPKDPETGNDPQLYNLDAVAYESIMLGLFQIWRGPDNDKCQGKPKITELHFAYSRDGFHWDRPDRTTAIRAERVPGSWDRGYIQSVGSVCTVMGAELWFYYGGWAGDESKANNGGMYAKAATGIAMLRRDGFASMDASGDGELLTRPMTFCGKHLFVNADVPDGSLQVEVLDLNGNVLAESTSFRGDSTLQLMPLKGGGDLSSLAGEQIRFRFKLEGGALYSFWVSKDQTGRSDGYVAGGGPGYTGPTDTVGSAAL